MESRDDTEARDRELQRYRTALEKNKSDAWTDLSLTLPIFIAYHLGVVFLPTRNAADMVTTELRALAAGSLPVYAGITLAIGAALFGGLWFMGRGHAFSKSRFLGICIEGAAYALLMRAAGSYAVGSLRLGGGAGEHGPFSGLVMSAGAGFYEELVFRVALFGGGAWLIKLALGSGVVSLLPRLGWALACALTFSAWHYVGALGDPFMLQSFVFRAVCGLVLTGIYAFRGFAPAVWTHFLYDVWVMVL
jgi:hypothetical protein